MHGWLLPASSVDALADAMREAIVAPKMRLDAMGQAAAKAVAANHDGRIEAAKLSALFGGSGTGIQTSRSEAAVPVQKIALRAG